MTGTALRPLKVGVLLPQIEGMFGGRNARWTDLLECARTAEAVGFDSVWVVDHLLFPPRAPGDAPVGCWELGTLLGALAVTPQRMGRRDDGVLRQQRRELDPDRLQQACWKDRHGLLLDRRWLAPLLSPESVPVRYFCLPIAVRSYPPAFPLLLRGS